MDQQQKYIDEVFLFAGKWEMPSHCGLMIRKLQGDTMIILTEMYETNPGSSATSMIETLAAEIVKKYSIVPEEATFIVRNPERSSRYTFFAETFYKAIMEWDGEKFVNQGWEKLKELK